MTCAGFRLYIFFRCATGVVISVNDIDPTKPNFDSIRCDVDGVQLAEHYSENKHKPHVGPWIWIQPILVVCIGVIILLEVQ